MAAEEEPVAEGGLPMDLALAYPSYPFWVPGELIGIGSLIALAACGLVTAIFGLPHGLLGLFVFLPWHAYWMVRMRRNPYLWRGWMAWQYGKPRPASRASRVIGGSRRDIVRYG